MAHDDVARKRADMPEGTETVLSARSLASSHARLNELLVPRMSVLDVGCGNGAITRGVVDKVYPGGCVVGVDISSRLIQEATDLYRDVSAISFQVKDVYDLGFDAEFDIVTAARVLQWLSNPFAALESSVTATVPGGRVVVLDYNHEKLIWNPEPPPSVQRFHNAFLEWRADAEMDNVIADRLESMSIDSGLAKVVVTPQHEETKRGDADFEQRIDITAGIISSTMRRAVTTLPEGSTYDPRVLPNAPKKPALEPIRSNIKAFKSRYVIAMRLRFTRAVPPPLVNPVQSFGASFLMLAPWPIGDKRTCRSDLCNNA